MRIAPMVRRIAVIFCFYTGENDKRRDKARYGKQRKKCKKIDIYAAFCGFLP
jgi:hypothetical protein